jgi:hypothetical protein
MKSSTTRSDNHTDSVNKTVYQSVTVVIFKHSASALYPHSNSSCMPEDNTRDRSPKVISAHQHHIALHFYYCLKIRLFRTNSSFRKKWRSHFTPKIASFQVICGKKLRYCENPAERPNAFREIHFRNLSKTWRYNTGLTVSDDGNRNRQFLGHNNTMILTFKFHSRPPLSLRHTEMFSWWLQYFPG